MSTLNRRAVIAAGAALPLAGTLTACGSDGESSESVATPEVEKGALIGAAADVPVGGCAVFRDPKVVITQPSKGEFKAFSAVCTHQGCLVSSSKDGEIPCTCHGSAFSLTDGAVLKGPANEPLAPVEIVVDGADVRAV